MNLKMILLILKRTYNLSRVINTSCFNSDLLRLVYILSSRWRIEGEDFPITIILRYDRVKLL